jgi:hypothetical protein
VSAESGGRFAAQTVRRRPEADWVMIEWQQQLDARVMGRGFGRGFGAAAGQWAGGAGRCLGGGHTVALPWMGGTADAWDGRIVLLFGACLAIEHGVRPACAPGEEHVEFGRRPLALDAGEVELVAADDGQVLAAAAELHDVLQSRGKGKAAQVSVPWRARGAIKDTDSVYCRQCPNVPVSHRRTPNRTKCISLNSAPEMPKGRLVTRERTDGRRVLDDGVGRTMAVHVYLSKVWGAPSPSTSIYPRCGAHHPRPRLSIQGVGRTIPIHVYLSKVRGAPSPSTSIYPRCGAHHPRPRLDLALPVAERGERRDHEERATHAAQLALVFQHCN